MKKFKNVLSLIFNVAIVAFTAYAISKYFISVGDANMKVSGTRCLVYFTNLSNILVAITALCMIPANIKNFKADTNSFSKGVFLLKYVGTVSVFVTLMTCVLFLGPVSVVRSGMDWSRYFTFFKGNVFFLHFLTPVLSVISVEFLERTHGFKKGHVWLGLIPTVIYGAVYFYQVVIVGYKNGGWYDFYGFTFGGKYLLVPVSMGAMVLLTWILAKTVYKINKKVNKVKK